MAPSRMPKLFAITATRCYSYQRKYPVSIYFEQGDAGNMKRKSPTDTPTLRIIESGKKNSSVPPEAWRYYRTAVEYCEEELYEHALALFDQAI